jgi:hypothetical protein
VLLDYSQHPASKGYEILQRKISTFTPCFEKKQPEEEEKGRNARWI